MLKVVGAGFASLTMLAQAVPMNPTVETVKVSLLAIITAAVLWTARTVFVNRDDTQKIKQLLFGVDGGNGKDGILSELTVLSGNMRAVLHWKMAMDAVEEYEKDMHPGEERRHRTRRLRDTLTEAHRQSGEHSTDID